MKKWCYRNRDVRLMQLAICWLWVWYKLWSINRVSNLANNVLKSNQIHFWLTLCKCYQDWLRFAKVIDTGVLPCFWRPQHYICNVLCAMYLKLKPHIHCFCTTHIAVMETTSVTHSVWKQNISQLLLPFMTHMTQHQVTCTTEMFSLHDTNA